MKQGTLITRVVILILFVAVLAYLGFTVWQGLSDPYRLVATYTYEMDDGLSLEGLVVRSEQVVEGRSALFEVLPQEGEKVSAGGAVALVYENADALSDRRQARSLELQLEQLQYAMRRNDTVGDGGKLDRELVDALAQLHSQTSAGELGALEECGLNLRSLVLKRTGDLTTSAQSLAALQAAAAQVESRLSALSTSAARSTRTITVPRSGVFSGLADGYEATLTPDILDQLTVSQLDRLESSQATAPDTAVGKLITGSTWYFATCVDEVSAQRLTEGKRYTMDFTGDFRQEVEMRLERLGPLEGDRRVAVFSSSEYLNKVTLARMESATLVFQRYSGIRVPDQALRVLDNGDGSSTLGVFTLVGRRAEFKSVEIIREGEGFYLVRGTATNRKVLRSGDVLILSNQSLYDGKVVA